MVTKALLPHVSHRFPLVPGVSACAVPRVASDGGYVVRASSNLRLRPPGVCPTRHPEWGRPRPGGAAGIPPDSCLRVAPLRADLDDIGLPRTPGWTACSIDREPPRGRDHSSSPDRESCPETAVVRGSASAQLRRHTERRCTLADGFEQGAMVVKTVVRP